MSRFVHPCVIRWGDLDAQGHLNNAVLVDYLQEARVDFLLAGPVPGMLDAGVVVVSHQVEYLRPVPFSTEPVRVTLWVDTVGAARFAISYELDTDDGRVARARTVVTPYDLGTGTIRRLTAEERAALTAHRDEPVTLRPVASDAAPEAPALRSPVRVRWSDLDAYGHVNNVKVYDYLQEARIAALAGVWSPLDTVVLLVRQDVDYLRPIDFRTDPYAVVLRVVDAGRTSMTLAGEVVDDAGTLYARGRSVIVTADPAGRPVPLPDAFRALAG